MAGGFPSQRADVTCCCIQHYNGLVGICVWIHTMTPNTSPARVSYGVCVVRTLHLYETHRVVMAPYCMLMKYREIQIWIHRLVLSLYFVQAYPCHDSGMQLYARVFLLLYRVYLAHVHHMSPFKCVYLMSHKCNFSHNDRSIDFHQAFPRFVYLMFQTCNSLSYNFNVDFHQTFACCCYFQMAINCCGEFHVECHLLSN